MFLLESGRGSGVKLVFLHEEREKFLAILGRPRGRDEPPSLSCCQLHLANLAAPARTDARNRILEITASHCSTLFGFNVAGEGGSLHFIHFIVALTLDPVGYMLMPPYCAMRTTVNII